MIKLPPLYPNSTFMFSHPAHLFSLGFGSGLFKWMPGTWGSIFGWINFFLFSHILTRSTLFFIGNIGLIAGIYLTSFTSRCLGKSDPKCITLDEIVAIWLIFCVTMPLSFWEQTTIFLLFRLFDISKPQPIKYIDKHLKNGIGIMFDDLIASLYTLLFWKIIQFFYI